jgi:hypothetical protein
VVDGTVTHCFLAWFVMFLKGTVAMKPSAITKRSTTVCERLIFEEIKVIDGKWV